MQTGQALIREIDATRVPDGDVAFWWLGQMSYVVKIGERVLYFDPYLSPSERRKVPPLLSPDEISHASIVFGSHDHMDHIDPLAIRGIVAASPGARFVCSCVNRARMASLGVDEAKIIALDEGVVYEEQGLRISAVAAAHEFLERDETLGYPHLCIIVEVSGVTLFHSGDTLCYEGLITKLSRWRFDLFFVCINGRDAERLRRGCIGNMTYQEAVDLAGALQPRLTVPGHWGMFADNSVDPRLFVDYMAVKYPERVVWVAEPGERLLCRV